jgi:hypothetical protein
MTLPAAITYKQQSNSDVYSLQSQPQQTDGTLVAHLDLVKVFRVKARTQNKIFLLILTQ